jgi:hypothetical protein
MGDVPEMRWMLPLYGPFENPKLIAEGSEPGDAIAIGRIDVDVA